jgi:hypothetical protein
MTSASSTLFPPLSSARYRSLTRQHLRRRARRNVLQPLSHVRSPVVVRRRVGGFGEERHGGLVSVERVGEVEGCDVAAEEVV